MKSNIRWLVLAIISSALFLVVIDMTVLYTALPRLTHDLRASASEKLWIMNAYTLTIAGLLPATGALSDRFGAKKLFTSGLAIFGIASILAAFSPDPDTLIAARVILAFGAAMMMPATLAIVRLAFEDPNERALAIGIWSAVASGGAALGPVIGGFLLEYYWWGSVFLINVPIVVVAFSFAIAVIAKSRGNPERSFDLIASVQIMIGLVSITYAIKELSKPVPSLETIAAIGTVGIIFTLIFIRRQQRSSAPMIDFNLFRNRAFTAGVATAFVATAALVGMELAVSQRFQLAMGLSPLQAGLLILPIPIASFIAGPLAGIAIPKLGSNKIMWLALALTGLGTFGYLIGLQSGLFMQIAAFSIIGFGAGAAMTAASTAIMLNAPEDNAGTAASIEETAYELGSLIGIAVLGSLMVAIYTASFSLPAGIDVSGLVSNSIDEALIVAEGLKGDAALSLINAAKQAFNHSFLSVLIAAGTFLMLAAGAIAIFGKEKRH
ncbi:Methyl viologen resistance protein smvA [Xenorhabdus nematophila ATCC 19061]|uniref:Methyl viologen resistance protein smvA n=1 Tax=Xenorhabdus nematophila (strain ATCC 19061 / DSM 3370 / CCUG 14189 / LMG 1036 / NCIMB 9965 / AN6) TaxID=406817 RepID=D3VEY6_XENNA|nr:MFS transporter [Xenorhabdus nematophila]CBJ92443.1 Methyl viologen resistance protein smvA [Xenorhabdus nematophila ATCC 19061]CEE90917.1 Methyl viologen resistance protein smvA [Xenorhabdus nematophila str. Anatoliense]CEE92243.1 Methyl viologen resistance protein smvA [Xenorhabdus nematophila str. Anatoliense]CEK25263.1 Methyl viologen resistance protein smvA [Xenorhabdus nematophila AN6/1]